jgi:glycosyltransferase involved in cell wall biosynthesis
MRRFAELGLRVLFVEPSESWPAVLSRARKSPLVIPRVREVLPGLSVLTPTLALPLRHNRLVSLLNHRAWSLQIRAALRRSNLRPDLMWIYDPRYADAVRSVRPTSLVFDMVDDYMPEEYGGWRVRRGTAWLLEHADVCIFTTPVLEGKYGSLTRAHLVVPNGFDPERFNLLAAPAPDDLPSLGGPILGFVGTLFRHIDFEVLCKAAVLARRRGGALVVIGGTEPSGREGAASVEAAGGILLGPRPNTELRGYIQAFSLCLAPFVKNEVAASVSPLKVYEYLACGRPVYATGLESLKWDPAGASVFQGGGISLESALDRALALTRKDFASLAAAAAVATWSARFEDLLGGLKRLGAAPGTWLT